MNLLCDEGGDRPIVSHLRDQGHSVVYIAELEPGASDDFILAKAAELNAPLMTTDKGFGELVFRQHRTSAGVILFIGFIVDWVLTCSNRHLLRPEGAPQI